MRDAAKQGGPRLCTVEGHMWAFEMFRKRWYCKRCHKRIRKGNTP